MAEEEELEPYADQVPVEGWWVGVSDDMTRTVLVTGPEDYSDAYDYTNVEEVHRAPNIVAIDAKAMAASISADLAVNTAALGQLEIDLQDNTTELENLDTALSENDAALAQLGEDLGDAGRLTAGTLNADRIGAGSITTGKIATDAVTADKILARAVSASKIATGTITANELASGSVTTDELHAGAVTSDKVTADTGWFTKLSALSAEFNAAFANKITADVISSGTLSGVEMYSPSPTALPRLKIGGSVLEVLRDDGDGDATSTFKLGGSTADEVVLYGADGQPMSGFTAEGNAVVDKELSVGSLRVGGDRIEELVRSASPEIVSYWETTWTPPKIGIEPYGLARFIFDMEAAYVYELVLDINLIGTAKDVAGLVIRYSSGSVTAGSYALDRTRFVFPDANVTAQGSRFVYRRVFGVRNMVYSNSYSGPMQIMPTLQNISTSSRPITLYGNETEPVVNSGYIKRLGPVNWHWASTDSGGGAPFSGTANPTPAPSTKQYVKTYDATSIRSYRGGSPVTSELGHGTYGGNTRYSSIIFPAQVKTDLTGATNVKVELYLENIHSYYGAGMTVRVGRTGDASHVYRTSGTSPTAVSWGRLDKKWVTLPSGFFTSSHQCIYLGEGASGLGEYGKFRYATSACKLRITYTK